MVNLHQICRLCMTDIGITGIDCLSVEDLRNAIKNLYNLVIKPEDGCSKRVCDKCFSMVADFMLHQRTVQDTQAKIKQFIDLQKQVNDIPGIQIKRELEDCSVSNAGPPIVEQSNAKQLNEVAHIAPARKKSTNLAEKKDTVRTETPNKNTQNAGTCETRSQIRNTKSTAHSQQIDGKKRRRSVYPDNDDQYDNSRIKRSKTSRRSLRSDDNHSDIRITPNRNAVQESPKMVANHDERLRQREKTLLESPKPKRNRKSNANVPSTSGQETILKYLSKPTCTKCDAVLKTYPESRFHQRCHQKKSCTVCKKSVSTKDVKNHVRSCLLMSGQVKTAELLMYMTPCKVYMDKNIDAVTDDTNNNENDKQYLNTEDSDMDSEILRSSKRKALSRPIIIDSSSEEEIKDTDTSATTKQTVNVVSDKNLATQTDTVVEMTSHQKKVARRESTVHRQEQCALRLNKDTTLPIIWNRLATGNRVFYAQTSFGKTANNYIPIEKNQLNHNISDQLDKIRLKIVAKTRSVPSDSDKQTSARKLNAISHYSNHRLSISDGDRLIKHTNAIVLFPPTFDKNLVPQNQTSQAKDRRKSIHNFSIRLEASNRNNENGPATVQNSSIARPAATYTSAAPPPPSQNASATMQGPISHLYNRPINVRNNINSIIVSTTSAAALTASSQPPPLPPPPSSSLPLTASTGAPISLQQLPTPRQTPHQSTLPHPPPIIPATKNTVKVLSVNELNSRAVQMNNIENRPTGIQNNGVRMNYVPIQPRPTPESPTSNRTDSGENKVIPINVALVKRMNNDLELTFTQHDNRISFEALSDSQRIEVQRSILNNNVWYKMLEHVKNGTPTEHTMKIFKRLLPQRESTIFFSTIAESQGPQNQM